MLIPQLAQNPDQIGHVLLGQPLIRDLHQHERVPEILRLPIRDVPVECEALLGVRQEERVPPVDPGPLVVDAVGLDDVAQLPGGRGPEDEDVGHVADDVVVDQVLEHGAVVAESGAGRGRRGRVGDEGLQGEDVRGGAVGGEAEGFDGAWGGFFASHDLGLVAGLLLGGFMVFWGEIE